MKKVLLTGATGTLGSSGAWVSSSLSAVAAGFSRLARYQLHRLEDEAGRERVGAAGGRATDSGRPR